MPVPLACVVVGVTGALAAIGCGGGSDSATVEQHTSASGAPQSANVEQPLTAAQVHGRDLFVQKCGACHTLDAAGTVGNVGPNLGDIAINEQDVLAAIRRGGGTHAKGRGVVRSRQRLGQLYALAGIRSLGRGGRRRPQAASAGRPWP